MGWSKRKFVTKAFSVIGMAGYVFDLEPEQLQDALLDLDSMMAAWNIKGIRVGYPLPSDPSFSDLDAETNVPDSAYEAISYGLSLRIAPAYGKTVTPQVAFFAKTSYDTLLGIAAMPMERQLPSTMPAGAGNKPWRDNDSPFVNPPVDPLLSGPDGPIEFN